MTTHYRPIIILASAILAIALPTTVRAGFVATGSLSGFAHPERDSHTATLLANGKVLVAGGYNSWSNFLATATLYDPATGTWVATENMSTRRFGHSATLLASGKVLVTGGCNYDEPQAELYDPGTGTWKLTGIVPLNFEVTKPSVLLPNGKVLVFARQKAAIYDPLADSWALAAAPLIDCSQPTVTLLPNGTVLLAGGNDNSNYQAVSSAQIFNPTAGTWTFSGSMLSARFRHTATLLSNGKVLVAGGTINYSTGLASAELYDPLTGVWSAAPAMPGGRQSSNAVRLPEGKVLIAGSNDLSDSTALLFNAETMDWSVTSPLTPPRRSSSMTPLSDGRVLIAGGFASSPVNDYLSDAVLFELDRIPEIVVENAAGTSLIDGTAVATLGSVQVGITGTAVTFTIRNTGDSDLAGIAISKNGSHPGDFIVADPVANILAAGASTTFTVTFKPTAGGTRSAAIHIASNDADENPFDLNLTGTATVPAPEIVVEQPVGSSLVDGTAKKSFGTVKVGKTGTAKSFTIKNTGTANLTGLAISKDGKQKTDFIVRPLTKTTLAAGTSTSFKITFKPTAKGTRNAAIHIKSNDANENPFDIKLTGAGAAP